MASEFSFQIKRSLCTPNNVHFCLTLREYSYIYCCNKVTVGLLDFRMAMSKLAKDQLKFVDPPMDEFNCPICLGILQEPYLTACCGNHFCEACIEKVKEGANKCPLCQETPLNG